MDTKSNIHAEIYDEITALIKDAAHNRDCYEMMTSVREEKAQGLLYAFQLVAVSFTIHNSVR
jgi:hypothetical protein